MRGKGSALVNKGWNLKRTTKFRLGNSVPDAVLEFRGSFFGVNVISLLCEITLIGP